MTVIPSTEPRVKHNKFLLSVFRHNRQSQSLNDSTFVKSNQTKVVRRSTLEKIQVHLLLFTVKVHSCKATAESGQNNVFLSRNQANLTRFYTIKQKICPD